VARAGFRARVVALLGAGLIAVTALAFVVDRQPPEHPSAKPKLMLLTTLPLVFGEKFGLEGGGSPALKALETRYIVTPVGIADARTLAKGRLLLMALLASVVALVGGLPSRVGHPHAHAAALAGIHKIRHVVVVMQENRSFDSYFGTYPGADGLPRRDGAFTVCVPDPKSGICQRPYHDTLDRNTGGPHEHFDAIRDIDSGKMDGFLRQARRGLPPACLKQPDAQGIIDQFLGRQPADALDEAALYLAFVYHG